MTARFAFRASEALHQDFVALQTAFQGTQLPAAPQARLAVQLTQRYTDEIVDALLLNLMRGSDADSHAPKAIETVASLIKSTVHALIRQILGKMDNAELKPVADFIASRRAVLDDSGDVHDYISFDLSPADHALLEGAWSAAASGQQDIPAMTHAMLRFSELAIAAFYEDSAKAIKLGFIARNMFNMGHAAISKGSRTAISRLIPSLKPRELQAFGKYFQGMLRND